MPISDLYNNQFNNKVKTSTPALSSLYPPAPVPTLVVPEDMYTRASKATSQKYGVNVPPHFLRAVQQQESSGIVDKNNLNLSMGFTPTAITALGKDYLPSTSLDNVVQNSANYLASRARGTLNDGTKFDLSTPENFSKWYVQRYVGLLPGQSRLIGGEKVPYEKIVSSFEKLLNQQ